MSLFNTTTAIPTTTIPTTAIPIDAYKSDPDLDASVKYAMDNCKPQLESTSSMVDAQKGTLEATMKLLNISVCQYKGTSTSTKAIAGTFLPLGLGEANVNTATQEVTGCEEINIMSNIMNQCTQQLSCMLNQVKSTSSSNVANFQEISVELGDVTGSQITLKNTSLTDVKTVNIAQSTVQSAIGATLTSSLQEALKQSMDITNEAYSNPTSQKNMSQLLSNLQSVVSNSTINQSIATTTNSMYQNQRIKLVARNITNSTVDLTNENTIQMISENYVYNALDQLFKTDVVAQSISTTTQESKTVSKGVDLKADVSEFENVVKNVTDTVGGFLNNIVSSTAFAYLITVIAIALVVLGGAYIFFRYNPASMLFGGGAGDNKKQKQQKDKKKNK